MLAHANSITILCISLDYKPVNETFTLNLVDIICVVLQVFEDGIVEGDEIVELHVTSDDPAILVVNSSSVVITIISSDSEKTLSG